MCFALPLRVKKKKGESWLMEDGREVKSILTESIKMGDYLLCRQNLAIEKLTKNKAMTIRRAIKGVSNELKKRR